MKNDAGTIRPAPHRIGEVFWIPLDDLDVDVATNMRKVEREELRELAATMRPKGGVGQLQAILVTWNGERYSVAVGFRRALAMLTFKEEMGFRQIKAEHLDPELATAARLIENLARKNPTSFETCKYLWEVTHGLGGHAQMFAADLAYRLGRSTGHVKKLARFYGALPDDLREIWRNDNDHRFTFRLLIKLSSMAHAGNEAALRAKVAEVLGVGAAGDEAPIVIALAKKKRVRSLMSRPTLFLALNELEALGDRIADDDRALLARDLLRCVTRRDDPRLFLPMIRRILADIGS